MNIELKRKMPTPQAVQSMYPVSKLSADRKKSIDEELRKIICGESEKLLLVIGPCSADREDAVLDYIHRLCKVQDEVWEKIIIVPRIYTNKPRTTGDGYKGMLHQPDPNASPDLFKGLISIRRLHMRALEESGFSCADEMLYPENHRYLSDLLSYVAIGARSVENQFHRLVASGLSIPVGMKNPTSGDLSVMLNAMTGAQHNHSFAYAGWEAVSKGNPMTHAILRGAVNQYGRSIPNYHYEDLQQLSELYLESGLKNPAVIVDTNHANSEKKWDEQPRIAKEVMHSMRHSEQVRKLVKGFMIESYLEDGNQPPNGTVYGQSITDPCIGWEKTVRLIYEMAELA